MHTPWAVMVGGIARSSAPQGMATAFRQARPYGVGQPHRPPRKRWDRRGNGQEGLANGQAPAE